MNKKITFIIYSLDCGGSERVVSLLANYFSINNHVEILVFSSNPSFYSLNNNIKYTIINYKKFNDFFSKFNSLSRIIALRKLFRKRKGNVFISFTTTINLISLISNLFLNRKLIISERTDPASENLSFLKSFLRSLTYTLSHHLVLQNKAQYNFYKSIISESQISIIENPISQFEPANYLNTDVNIINIGRLVETKNQIDLIDAFIKSKLNCKLYIIGEGPLKEKLHNYIISRNQKDKIFLVGLIDNVNDFLHSNNIFASTSILEGYPNALLEAMNAGLSCLHYDCPSGVNEIIKDGHNGLLSPINNVELFSSKLIMLYSDKELRNKLGNNAIMSLKELDIESISSKWLELIKSCNQ